MRLFTHRRAVTYVGTTPDSEPTGLPAAFGPDGIAPGDLVGIREAGEIRWRSVIGVRDGCPEDNGGALADGWCEGCLGVLMLADGFIWHVDEYELVSVRKRRKAVAEQHEPLREDVR